MTELSIRAQEQVGTRRPAPRRLRGAPPLNRAVAVGRAFGPGAGLDLVEQLVAVRKFETYHLLPSVRGDFLAKLGRLEEARAEFQRAAALTRNARERALLLDRAAACSEPA